MRWSVHGTSFTPRALLVLLGAGLVTALSVFGQGTSPVVINEVMADNATALTDDEGNHPDWVELYNRTTTNVNLAGWRLTDTQTTNKFIFPNNPNSVVGPGRFLVVYCDDATNLPGIHCRFALGKKGSYLRLTNMLAYPRNLGDFVWFGPQVTDYSVGRIPDGNGAFRLNYPTPERFNIGAPVGASNVLRINEWAATNHHTWDCTNNGTITVCTTNSGKDWIELYNPSTNIVALGGLVMSEEPIYRIPGNAAITSNSFIAPESFLQFDCVGDSSDGFDELDFKLSHNTGETVSLYPPNRNTNTPIDRITFPGTNVAGYWVVDRSYGRLPDGETTIVRFEPNRTTPGKSNFQPLTNVVVSEILAHTDPPLEDAIEFYNPTTEDVNISRWWLSNERRTRKKWLVPTNTIVPALGFKVFYEYGGGTSNQGFNWRGTGSNGCFTLNSANGDRVVLTATSNNNPNALTGYEATYEFGPTHNAVSLGRYLTSDDNDQFPYQSQRSFGMDNPSTLAQFRTGTGRTNAYPMVGPLVISEIMYHPPDLPGGTDDSTNEFVEILNITSTNVPLYDPVPFGTYNDPNYPQYGTYADGRTNTWRLRGNVDLDFPTNVSLSPGQYLLLVNFAPTNLAMSNTFARKFRVPAGVRLFGPYSGKLSNKDSNLELRGPDRPQGPQHPDFRLVPYATMEKVHYYDGGTNGPPWPTNTDGSGYSLHRVCLPGYGNDPTNWVVSIPTPGAPGVDPTLQLVGEPSTNGGTFTFGFEAKAGWSYTVQYRSLLDPSGAWLDLQDHDARPTNYWCEVVEPVGVASKRYYRVITPRQ